MKAIIIIIVLIILAVVGHSVYRRFSTKKEYDDVVYHDEIALPDKRSIDKNGRYYGCLRANCANDDKIRDAHRGCKTNECYCRYYKCIVRKKNECRHYSYYTNSKSYQQTLNNLAELLTDDKLNMYK